MAVDEDFAWSEYPAFAHIKRTGIRAAEDRQVEGLIFIYSCSQSIKTIDFKRI